MNESASRKSLIALRYCHSLTAILFFRYFEQNNYTNLLAVMAFCQSLTQFVSIADYGNLYKVYASSSSKICLSIPIILLSAFSFVVYFTAPVQFKVYSIFYFLFISIFYPMWISSYAKISDKLTISSVKSLIATFGVQVVILLLLYLNLLSFKGYQIVAFSFLAIQFLASSFVRPVFSRFTFKVNKSLLLEGLFPSLLMVTSYIGAYGFFLFGFDDISISTFFLTFKLVMILNIFAIWRSTFVSDSRPKSGIYQPNMLATGILKLIFSTLIIYLLFIVSSSILYPNLLSGQNLGYHSLVLSLILLSSITSVINAKLIASSQIPFFFLCEFIGALSSTLYRFFAHSSVVDLLLSVCIFYFVTTIVYLLGSLLNKEDLTLGNI